MTHCHVMSLKFQMAQPYDNTNNQRCPSHPQEEIVSQSGMMVALQTMYMELVQIAPYFQKLKEGIDVTEIQNNMISSNRVW